MYNKYKIFIVEDDPSLAAMLKKNIEAWDHEVYNVKDLRKVTEEFQEQQPHLVIMDIMLPFYNGYHWCEEIRRISNVPIIFLTSASDNMNIVMAMQTGGDDLIAKPVDPSVLMAKIHAILRRVYDLNKNAPILEQ